MRDGRRLWFFIISYIPLVYIVSLKCIRFLGGETISVLILLLLVHPAILLMKMGAL
jgi:hypothetical protein